MKRRNQNIIKKFINRTFAVDKKRNFFVISAIASTSFMIASVISFGVGIFESLNYMQIMNYLEFIMPYTSSEVSIDYISPDLSTYITYSIIVLLIMLMGFLLICNMMHLSVIRDIRFFGKLKTLGATSWQIWHIIIGHIIRFLFLGLLIGCLSAAAFSFIILPSFLLDIIASNVEVTAVVSFSPLVYIVSVLFTILTVLFAAFYPSKKASSIAPIEAINYSSKQVNNRNFRYPLNGKLYRMAFRNLAHEGRKFIIVVLSLSLGIVLFITGMAFADSFDVDTYIEELYDYDISIVAIEPDPMKANYISKNFVQMATDLSGTENIRLTTNMITFEFAYVELGGGGLIGIDSRKLLEVEGMLFEPIDIEAFERGEIALLRIREEFNMSSESLVNNSASIFEKHGELDIFIGQENIPAQIKIAGIAREDLLEPTGFVMTSNGFNIFVSHTWLERYLQTEFGSEYIVQLDIIVSKDQSEEVLHALSALIEAENNKLRMVSHFSERIRLEESRASQQAAGIIISGIFMLCGIFNFVNLMSVGVLLRRRELAMLESVGMSKKQIERTLMYEGLGYWLAATFISLIAGSLIAYHIVQMLGSVPYSYTMFNYPFMQTFVLLFIVLVICALVPQIVYRNMTKVSLVDRLREEE